jgi:hypothetical protein
MIEEAGKTTPSGNNPPSKDRVNLRRFFYPFLIFMDGCLNLYAVFIPIRHLPLRKSKALHISPREKTHPGFKNTGHIKVLTA